MMDGFNFDDLKEYAEQHPEQHLKITRETDGYEVYLSGDSISFLIKRGVYNEKGFEEKHEYSWAPSQID